MSGKAIYAQLNNSTFSQAINIIWLYISQDTQSRGRGQEKKFNIWTYLLVVFELDIEPTGLDHPLLCS